MNEIESIRNELARSNPFYSLDADTELALCHNIKENRESKKEIRKYFQEEIQKIRKEIDNINDRIDNLDISDLL